MSTLGMSASPSRADMLTSARMSAKCHKRTSAKGRIWSAHAL